MENEGVFDSSGSDEAAYGGLERRRRKNGRSSRQGERERKMNELEEERAV